MGNSFEKINQFVSKQGSLRARLDEAVLQKQQRADEDRRKERERAHAELVGHGITLMGRVYKALRKGTAEGVLEAQDFLGSRDSRDEDVIRKRSGVVALFTQRAKKQPEEAEVGERVLKHLDAFLKVALIGFDHVDKDVNRALDAGDPTEILKAIGVDDIRVFQSGNFSERFRACGAAYAVANYIDKDWDQSFWPRGNSELAEKMAKPMIQYMDLLPSKQSASDEAAPTQEVSANTELQVA